MGNPANPVCVKLIASLICQNNDVFVVTLTEMVSHFGSLDFVSETMPFDFTDYYTKEMGEGLWRRIVGFESLINPEAISSIKLFTNHIETSLSTESKQRKANIDPGYINANHLLLATTKPAPHRPYLKDGIYSDLTLLYQQKGFKALPWTYPDYRSDKIIGIMQGLRQKYFFQLNNLKEGSA